MWTMFKLTIKTLERRCQNDVIDVVLVYLLLTWTYFTPLSSVFIVNFEQVNVSWVENKVYTGFCTWSQEKYQNTSKSEF